MSNKNNNRKSTDNRKQRVVNSDGRNSAGARGSTRKRNTLDLEFEFDFMKKEKQATRQYGLIPELNPYNDTINVDLTDKHAGSEANEDRRPPVNDNERIVNKEGGRPVRRDTGEDIRKTITKADIEAVKDAPDMPDNRDLRKTITKSDAEDVRKTIAKTDTEEAAGAADKPESKDSRKTIAKVDADDLRKTIAKTDADDSGKTAVKSGKSGSADTAGKEKKPQAGQGKNKKKGASKTVKSATRKKNNKSGNPAGSKKKPAKKKPVKAALAAGASGKAVKKTTGKIPKLNEPKKPSGSKPSGSNSKANKKTKKKRKKKNKFLWFLRCLIITFISLAILGGIAGGAYTAYVVSHAEPIHPEKIYDTLPVTSHIYDDKGKLIDDIYYSENREITTYEELPDDLKNAFVAIEDKTFWTHKGFNFRRIVGAILEKFKGGSISGTSTITQQLARNVFLPEEKSVRSLKRKITEMYYAYEIEEVLSKEDILTAYLNTIYLGYGCYGVDTAAKIYFAKDIQDLSLEQCAALAALPQAPGLYALLVSEPGDYTTEIKSGMYANDISESRRNLVLRLMEEQGYITAEQREEATKPLADFIKPGSTAGVASTSAFKDYLIETVKHDLMEQYGMTEDQAVDVIYTKGLNIYSTLDSQAQKVITKQFKDKSNFPSTAKKKVSPEAAMVITEVGTGKIKAMVGTRNADGQMLFNRATNPRQPGSSIKPLTVYAAALQKSYEYNKKGKTFKFTDTGYDKQGTKGWGDYITVSSKVVDEKMKVKGETWPLNVTRTYSGDNTFRTAIQKSINTCAVKILAQVGVDYSMNMLQKFGITTAIDDTSQSVNDLNLAALGLGAMSEGVSPLEMALAYATFPNGGVRNTGICYTKVEDSDGKVILKGKSNEVKVLNEGVAWIMTNVLQSVVTQGIGYPAAVSGERVGGKTGTTDSRYDIWFCGFTPKYSAALWIGTDNNVQMDSYSEKAAALWGKIMSDVKRGKGGEYRSMPKNVFRAWDGEFYTNGTAPPEPEPEPEEEEEEDGEKKDDKDKDGKDDKKDDKDKSSKDDKKSDKKD